MLVAIVAGSTAGPLTAAAIAPGLAIAFWRNALSAAATVPVALHRSRPELAGLSRNQLLFMATAGLLLAAHFGTWMASLAFTTVASAIAMTATQPVWAALVARVRGQRLPPRAWLGIAVAVTGVAMITGIDLTVSPSALGGDLLALTGGIFGAGYITAGGEIRGNVSTTSYTLVCYGAAAAALLVVCLFAGLQLAGFSPATWLMIAAIAAGPQLIGHSLFNRALRTTSPTVVSLATLFITPCAALIAWAWLGQSPPLTIIPAIALLLGGVALVVTSRFQWRRQGGTPRPGRHPVRSAGRRART
ncbi:MAG: EamA family transporter [Pseudonocardiaceae bacterium]|nr:EamA family transporter [Pseudonocardiaceae bacterium]